LTSSQLYPFILTWAIGFAVRCGEVVSDRAHFSPIVAAPFAPGKYLVIVAR
jgi:hypothetical protein